MNRMEELAITVCVLDLAGIGEHTTETALDTLNSRISEVLGVRRRDYTRSVDDALTLIPEGWSAEISWEITPRQSSVALSTPNPNEPEKTDRLVSHASREGVTVHFPLPIAICIAALNVHSLVRKRTRRSRNVTA